MHQSGTLSMALNAVLLVAGMTGGSSFAAVVPDGNAAPDQPAVQQQLEQMRRELNDMRKENQSMRTEIDDLRARTDADWLTEARANEIRGLVADMLADADTRASLLQSGLAAGWSDHFFLADPNGRFKLVLEGQWQFRYIYNFHDEIDRHRRGFEIARTRLLFSGFVFSPDIEYMVQTDFFGNRAAPGFTNLLDAWVRFHLNDEWSLRLGQFKLPFNREKLVSPVHQLAVERSLINEVMNIGRSQGAELMYLGGPSRLSMAFSDGGSPSQNLANVLGQPHANRPALVQGNEWAATARYEHLVAGTWDQFADFTSRPEEEFGLLLGLAGHAQHSENTGLFTFGRDEIRWYGYTADVSAEFGGATAFASFTHHYVDSPADALGAFNVIGIVAQLGVYIAPKWEVFARAEYGSMEARGSGTISVPDLNLVTAGFNYYIDGHDVKWTTDIGFGISELRQASPPIIANLNWASDLAGWRPEGSGARPQVVFRSQLQLLW